MSLSNMIKIAQTLDFGTLYIKPAFVFIDGDVNSTTMFKPINPKSMSSVINISLVQDDIVEDARLATKDRASHKLLDQIISQAVGQ